MKKEKSKTKIPTPCTPVGWYITHSRSKEKEELMQSKEEWKYAFKPVCAFARVPDLCAARFGMLVCVTQLRSFRTNSEIDGKGVLIVGIVAAHICYAWVGGFAARRLWIALLSSLWHHWLLLGYPTVVLGLSFPFTRRPPSGVAAKLIDSSSLFPSRSGRTLWSWSWIVASIARRVKKGEATQQNCIIRQ
jgi:hypothetical protein